MSIREGYATWTDRESGKVVGEAKTVGCAHCQRLIVMHTATGARVDAGAHRTAPRPESHDPGGWCGRCAAAICGPCCDEMAKTLKCSPFEQRLERMEGRGRLLAALGVALLVMIAACSAPAMPPRARSEFDAARAAVRVEAICASVDLDGESIEWWSHTGAGVLVGDRHALTAAHVVGPCPEAPTVYVTLFDRRRIRVHVERDDATYGKGEDLARLVSSSSFQRFIPPPVLGNSDGVHYAIAFPWATYRGARHELGRLVRPGDSGSAVYAPSGALVGLLLGTDDTGLRIVRVDETWR